MRLMPALALSSLLAAGLSDPVRAQVVDARASEQQRITAERAAAETRFAERQRECQQRFVVTSCVDDAKRERSAALSQLRRRQSLLDDGQRDARTAERKEAIRQRTNAEAARARETKDRAGREPGALIDHPRHAERPAEAASEASSKPARDAEARGIAPLMKGSQRTAQEEERSRATFDAAQRAAAAHRAEVEERNAKRAARHKPAAPLPLPPAASAP
jgi:colicin import membrane protein